MTVHAEQVKALHEAASGFAGKYGAEIAAEMESNASFLLAWVEQLAQTSLTGHADELLSSVRAAIRESAACSALGAVRPSLFSLRAQIDLSLAWLFFKDHPREFSTVCNTGNGFILKEKIIEYLKNNYLGFGGRFAKLAEVCTRKEPEPYRLLSAHIHSQSALVLPEVSNLSDIVQGSEVARECAAIQFDVSEYLSDLFFSTGLVDYRTLPNQIIDQITGRALSNAHRAVIFSFD